MFFYFSLICGIKKMLAIFFSVAYVAKCPAIGRSWAVFIICIWYFDGRTDANSCWLFTYDGILQYSNPLMTCTSWCCLAFVHKSCSSGSDSCKTWNSVTLLSLPQLSSCSESMFMLANLLKISSAESKSFCSISVCLSSVLGLGFPELVLNWSD